MRLFGRRRDEPGKAGRILFPFTGASVSGPALEAALRLARAEDRTLMPAYLATVPHQRSLEAPIADECDEVALPLLEAVEQRAGREHVAVDSRIERGRSPRHALSLLLEHERYDALVLAARGGDNDGFGAADVAWALENAPGDVFVVRPHRESRAPNGR